MASGGVAHEHDLVGRCAAVGGVIANPADRRSQIIHLRRMFRCRASR